MKQEHEYRLEMMKQMEMQGGGPASGGGPRTVGGGRPLQPKSLRGGGGLNRSFNWGDGMNRTNSMNVDDIVDQNASYSRNNGANGSSSSQQAMAVVMAEAVPVEDDDMGRNQNPAPAAAKTPSKSSVFSRMLKGQK